MSQQQLKNPEKLFFFCFSLHFSNMKKTWRYSVIWHIHTRLFDMFLIKTISQILFYRSVRVCLCCRKCICTWARKTHTVWVNLNFAIGTLDICCNILYKTKIGYNFVYRLFKDLVVFPSTLEAHSVSLIHCIMAGIGNENKMWKA